MSDVFDLRARVSADASPFNKAMDSSANSVSSALSEINSAASMFIGNGVVRAFSRAIDAAYEFGQVMADISSISDVGIQQLSKNIKQLDNVYGSMSNVGNSIYNIISSGFDKGEEALLSIVKNVGQASKSIRADLYSTANVFTTVANAYNLSADQFKNIADLLFVTVKEGKAEGNELARTLGLVVNTASEAGLSFAEMSAVISTLSRTQTTSQAMIGFNQMLNAMIKPSKEAADTAAQFGIEFGAAALKSKGFTAIIKDMHDKLQGNVEAINKISGPIRAMRAVVSLTGKQYENFIDILENAEAQIGTGVAMEAFAKQTNTAKQALENLKVQLDKTFITVGTDLEPITRHMSEFAEIFLKTFGSGEGYSLGGIGRAGAYISGIGLVIKGVVSSVKLLKNFSTSMVRDGNSLTSSSNTFAANVERAQRALQMSAASISDINTRMKASALPNQHRMEQRALHPSPAMIKAQAQANINAMYLRNSKGALYDPSTGRLVSERKLLAEEIARLTKAYKLERESIPKQVRRDNAAQRYNRRFGTNYGSYDEIKGTGKLRRRWKVLGANVSKGLTKLGAGLLNASLMVAAWETGWAIGTSIAEKLKIADWRLTQWIADLTLGKTPGSTLKQEEEQRKHNLKVMKKSTQAMADRLLNVGKMTEAEHASISAEIELSKATDTLAKLRNKMASKDTPKEEPKPVKTEDEVEAENRKNRAEAIAKVERGEYTASKSSGLQDKIQEVLDKYDLPDEIRDKLFKHYTSAEWRKEFSIPVMTQKQYDSKLAIEYAALRTGVYMDRTQRNIAELKKANPAKLEKEIKAIDSEVSALRILDADATVQERREDAVYASTKSEAKNTLDTATERFKKERTAPINAEKYRKTDLNAVALSSEISREALSNIAVFNKASENYEKRFADYLKQQKYFQEQEKKLRMSGLKNTDISEVTSKFKSELELFAKTLESERKSLIELAEQHAMLPKLTSEQQLEEAEAAGVDTESEKFLRDRAKHYDSISIQNLGKRSGETTLQQNLRLRRSRAYQEVADEAFNELMKSRESVRQNKVSAGMMTDLDATRGTLSDLSEASIRINGIIEAFKKLSKQVDINSIEFEYYTQRIDAYKDKLKEIDIATQQGRGKFYDIKMQRRSDLRQKRASSGIISEMDATRGDIVDLQYMYNMYANNIKRLKAERSKLFIGSDTRREYTERIRAEQRKLTDTSIKLRGEFNKLAEKSSEVRKGLMSTIQEFTAQRDDSGKMTNDALWHSVNLASRMGGIPRSKPYMVETTGIPNRYKADRMRKQAQGAISASVDSWIMSQKYAEANVGQTVTDIFKFMQQNNTIVVRKQ